ncbi:6795_t:CDS:1, partial [Gigaspora rosea]
MIQAKNITQILAIVSIRNHALVDKTARYAQDAVIEFYVDNAKILSSI